MLEGEVMDGEMPAADAAKVIAREMPTIPEDEKALVADILKEIEADKEHFKKPFARMRRDQDFAMNAEGEQWDGDDDKYVANLIARHIRERTAALYAKNPRAVAKRRKRLDFAVWDGKPESLKDAFAALQGSMAAGLPAPPPEVMALVQDIEAGRTKRALLDRVGKTLEVLFQYYLDEAEPRFKPQAKQLIRRIETNGVGYIKLDFQRKYATPKPGVSAQLADQTTQLSNIERLSADLADGEFDENSARAAELRTSIEALQAQATILEREGITFDFPPATAIIPSRKTKQLQGWIGTDHLAQEYEMTAEEIKRIYKVDISCAKPESGQEAKSGEHAGGKKDGDNCPKVYEYWHKLDGVVYTVSPSWPGFLKKPEAPIVLIERFYPIWAVCFNELEHEKQIFPPSDVRLLMHQQKEHNRVREGLRQHRIANTPFNVFSQGAIDEPDREKLKMRKAHDNVPLNVPPGTKASDLFSAYVPAPIDPSAYDSAPIFEDIMRVSGSAEANFGGTGDSTATEASIAEGGRVSSLDSNRDDLDQVLTEVADAAGQVMLMELSKETVVEIVGPGAIWPDIERSDMVRGIGLTVKAGSSGRPNKAQNMANLERIMPWAIQMPGFNPSFLVTKVAEEMDDTIDLEDALLAGAPSVLAMNAMASKPPTPANDPGAPAASTGDPASDPGQQGGAGADNAPLAGETPGGPQPAYPAPAEATPMAA
jgi:hypothetical protein